MKYLVIYDTDSGEIELTSTVSDENKHYNGGLIVDVPDGKILEKIDPATKEPVFAEYIDPIDSLKNDITDLQVALAEVYEAAVENA